MKVSRVSKQDILDAARAVVFARGLRALRLDDLARDLGISKKTLYQHFDDKEALVREVVLDTFEAMVVAIEHQLDSPGPALDKLDALFDHVQRFVASLPPGAVVELARLYPRVVDEVLARRRRFLTRYLGVIARGQRAGEIRSDIPARALSQGVLALIETLGTPAFVARSGLSLVDVVQMIRKVFLRGLRVRAAEESPCDARSRRRSRRR